jgi:DNA-binding GntR family transcriptional regulator
MLAHFQSELFREYAPFIQGWTPRDISDPLATIEEHCDIISAVEAHDPDAASTAMGQHLRELEVLTTDAFC